MIQIVYINCNCIKEEPLSRIFWKFQKIFPKTINSSAYNSRWIHVWLEVYLDISIYFPENFVENSRDSFLIHFLHLIKNSAWLVENWRRKVWNYFPQKWITVTDNNNLPTSPYTLLIYSDLYNLYMIYMSFKIELNDSCSGKKDSRF